MFEINATFAIFIASFLVFMFLLNKIMLEPVGKIIDEREKRIKGHREAGKEARQEAEAILKHYQEHLHTIRAQAQSTINDAVDKASQQRHAQISQLKNEGLSKLNDAKALIQSERNALMEELVKQEIDLVQDITQKLVGEPVTLNLDANKVRLVLTEEAS